MYDKLAEVATDLVAAAVEHGRARDASIDARNEIALLQRKSSELESQASDADKLVRAKIAELDEILKRLGLR